MCLCPVIPAASLGLPDPPLLSSPVGNHQQGGASLGRTSHGDSHQEHKCAGRNREKRCLYTGENTAPLPSGGLLLYSFYPFPIFVEHWEEGRTGNLGALQMGCSHSHRPDLCPILPTPKGAMRNRLHVQCRHLQILDVLLISATGTSVASSRVAAWGMELLTAAR